MNLDEAFPRKLGVKDGHLVLLENAPPQFQQGLAPLLPPSCTVQEGLAAEERADVIILWPKEETLPRFPTLKSQLKPAGSLWVVIPKKPVAIKRGTNITFDMVQRVTLTTSDLVDNKTLTFSDEEYGVRFVIRKGKRG